MNRPVEAVEIRCPRCGRFLAEAADYGRAVCRDDGWEIEVRSAEQRRREKPRDVKYPRA